MQGSQEIEIARRLARLEVAIFGDPMIKDDRGMKADLHDLVTLQQSGGLAIKMITGVGMAVGFIALSWQWVWDHFTIGLRP